MADHDEYKRCPDCAELVLEAARKCRYCGYRFDTGRRERRTSALVTLLPGLVQAPRDATMPEILADWNVTLVPGEEVRFFTVGMADDRPGYLLITTARIMFFAARGRRDHEMHFAYPLSRIGGVRRRGPRWRPRLVLQGPDGRHELHSLGAARTRRIDGYLVEHGVMPLDDDSRQPTV